MAKTKEIPEFERKQEFVERAGVQMERMLGFSPIIGRVVAYLFVAEPPEQTFFEIKDFVNASKSAISNAINHLLRGGSIEEITKPGDRKRYFRLSMGKENFPAITQDRVKLFEALEKMAAEAIEIRSDKDSRFTENLKDLIELYKIFQEEFPKIIEKWKARK